MLLNKINIKLFYIINNLAGSNNLLDKMGILSAKYFPFFFIFLLLYLWFRKKSYRNLVFYSIYAVILGLMFNFLITLFYFHPRPFMDKIGILLIKHSSNSSFPSDHATFLFSIALIFLFSKNTRLWGVILFILAWIGSAARVFVGVHYPFDILGSILVSIISTLFIYYNKSRLNKINNIFLKIYSKFISKNNNFTAK